MNIQTKVVAAKGIKFSIFEDEVEIARAYLYVMHNDLHQEPFGLLEDVYVSEQSRGKGMGTRLINQVMAAAQEQGCYKLIATSRKSRPKVHQLYKNLGFQERGLEFRIDF
ncbi:N-acetyltransferase [Pleurocapsa sp. PCC 7319]|uniref:GNAT family N-acetyltransferase n=1 Tax=Pleurocapsa sp. PCC 7319 TaxID=118161 RepID=UPI000347BBE4|nr:GNAT family N-acetyltransferase [Pleurocapsa sp. PCC 7319]